MTYYSNDAYMSLTKVEYYGRNEYANYKVNPDAFKLFIEGAKRGTMNTTTYKVLRESKMTEPINDNPHTIIYYRHQKHRLYFCIHVMTY